jgi:hypothetical protein
MCLRSLSMPICLRTCEWMCRENIWGSMGAQNCQENIIIIIENDGKYWNIYREAEAIIESDWNIDVCWGEIEELN